MQVGIDSVASLLLRCDHSRIGTLHQSLQFADGIKPYLLSMTAGLIVPPSPAALLSQSHFPSTQVEVGVQPLSQDRFLWEPHRNRSGSEILPDPLFVSLVALVSIVTV